LELSWLLRGFLVQNRILKVALWLIELRAFILRHDIMGSDGSKLLHAWVGVSVNDWRMELVLDSVLQFLLTIPVNVNNCLLLG
jgi:hypothetical protein